MPSPRSRRCSCRMPRSLARVSGAAGQAEGTNSESARQALRAAGDRAASLGVHAASAHFSRAALDLWPEDAPERPALLVSAGRESFWADGTGIELLEQGFEALRSA